MRDSSRRWSRTVTPSTWSVTGSTITPLSNVHDLYCDQRYCRQRTVESVLLELEHAVNRLPTCTVSVYDDLFTLNREWALRFAAEYKKRVALPFCCYTRPATVSKEVHQALLAAGLNNTAMGGQSGSERTLYRVFSRRTDHTSQRAWMEPSPLRTLFWNVTYASNYRCPICFTDGGSAHPDELTTAEALETVKKVHAAGVRDILISGGESFQREDLVEILTRMAEHGITARTSPAPSEKGWPDSVMPGCGQSENSSENQEGRALLGSSNPRARCAPKRMRMMLRDSLRPLSLRGEFLRLTSKAQRSRRISKVSSIFGAACRSNPQTAVASPGRS